MASERLPIALFGAGGRMGQALATALADHPRLSLRAALHAGSDLTVLNGCAAAIDFTVPEASRLHAEAAAHHGVPLVVGTTGLSAEQTATLEACAVKIPLLHSANMSLGANLLAALVEQAARALGPDHDIEILEMHHRRKADAPSGTALMLGQAAARGRGRDFLAPGSPDRSGSRPAGGIGFASLRGGDVAGDHTVYFAGEGERLELTHRATSRAVFAHGALRAAEWLVGKAPGLYGMRDVLG